MNTPAASATAPAASKPAGGRATTSSYKRRRFRRAEDRPKLWVRKPGEPQGDEEEQEFAAMGRDLGVHLEPGVESYQLLDSVLHKEKMLMHNMKKDYVSPCLRSPESA
jgi:hypothetical protein